MHHARVIEDYNALADARSRYSNWRIVLDSEGAPEEIDCLERTIYLNPCTSLEYAVAHVIAHLDLGHLCIHSAAQFTGQQERDAHDLATLRLDQEGSREVA